MAFELPILTAPIAPAFSAIATRPGGCCGRSPDPQPHAVSTRSTMSVRRTASQSDAARQGADMDASSDEELLTAARADPEAFAAFYRRHARPVAGFFAARTHDAEVAAALTAETFAAALEGVDRFRPDRGAATAWLYGIARHQLSRWQRTRSVDDRARRRLGMERLDLDDADLERVGALAGDEAATVRVWVEQ